MFTKDKRNTYSRWLLYGWLVSLLFGIAVNPRTLIVVSPLFLLAALIMLAIPTYQVTKEEFNNQNKNTNAK